VALVRTDVSEEPGASFIRVTKIGALGTTQAATSNRRTLRWRRQVPPKRRFLQEPHGVTTQKTQFFKFWFVTAVPKHLNSDTFSNDLFPIFISRFWPAFWSRDTNIYLVFSMFTSRPTFLLASIRVCVFLFIVSMLSPKRFTSSA
jgi:hypothetical protein